MLAALLNRPVQITHRVAGGTIDAYGNQTDVESTTATVGELQQRARDEQDDLSQSDWLLFLPPGTVIASADVVTVDGQRFEVLGDPWAARNPRTRQESHIEASLRRVAGSGDA